MTWALVALLVVHGLLHLLGFVQAWHFALLPQLSGATLFTLSESFSKLVGTVWLLVCGLFLASAVALAVQSQCWWRLGMLAVISSELLIIYAWPDAKAGTLVNLLLVLPLLASAAHASFDRQTALSVSSLWSNMSAPSVVLPEELAALPPPVRRWLESAGVVGRARAQTLRLEQTGWMRTSPKSAWMPAKAAQYFNVEEPGFVWAVELRMKGWLPIVGRDSYLAGRGRMLIKPLSLVSVVDASDEKIRQGTLLRYLGEMVWFPSAALSPYLHWESIDDQTAKVTMQYRGASGSAVFSFNALGRVVNVSAKRFMNSGPSAKLEQWSIPLHEWQNLGGVVIPVAGDVTWKLATGDFTYYRWRVGEVEYNRPQLY
jgi:hypothetical protein